MYITRRRIARAFPVIGGLLAILPILALVFPSTVQPSGPSADASHVNMLRSPYLLISLIAVFALLFQTWTNYVRDWFNPTLALRYQDRFESEDVLKKRSKAARYHKENKKWDKSIDWILDIFEDVGFYVAKDEMSAEVAHHHFYYWIRGYIQTAQEYIRTYQIDDPTAHEWCEYLLKEVSKVEAAKSKTHIAKLTYDQDEIDEFIKDEIDEAG